MSTSIHVGRTGATSPRVMLVIKHTVRRGVVHSNAIELLKASDAFDWLLDCVLLFAVFSAVSQL